jgi:hypothetical protein
MKKSLLILLLLMCASLLVQAGPCVTGNLSSSSYGNSTFSCSIDGLTFSNFHYLPTATNTVVPDGAGVTVNPIPTGTEIGLQFAAGWGAGPGAEEDSLIEYTATCNGCLISDVVLLIAGAGASGNSFVNVAETSSAPPIDLVTGVTGLGVSSFSDMTTLSPPVSSLDLSKDIHVNGGTTGFGAAVSSVSNLFSLTTTTMTPEPSLLVVCAGILALIPVARRRFSSRT